MYRFHYLPLFIFNTLNILLFNKILTLLQDCIKRHINCFLSPPLKVCGLQQAAKTHLIIRQCVFCTRRSAKRNISPASIYLLKANNRNTRTRYEKCSKLTIETPKRRLHRSGVFIVNFEHISHLALMFLLSTFNM